jgi:hypothetical protein
MVPNDSISGNWSICKLRNNIKLQHKYVRYKAQGWQEDGSRSALYRVSTVQQTVCPAKTGEQIKTRCTMGTPREVNSSRKAEQQEMYPTLCPENISPLQHVGNETPQKQCVCHGRGGVFSNSAVRMRVRTLSPFLYTSWANSWCTCNSITTVC